MRRSVCIALASYFVLELFAFTSLLIAFEEKNAYESMHHNNLATKSVSSHTASNQRTDSEKPEQMQMSVPKIEQDAVQQRANDLEPIQRKSDSRNRSLRGLDGASLGDTWKILMTFTKLTCHDETDPEWVGSDETYAIFSMLELNITISLDTSNFVPPDSCKELFHNFDCDILERLDFSELSSNDSQSSGKSEECSLFNLLLLANPNISTTEYDRNGLSEPCKEEFDVEEPENWSAKCICEWLQLADPDILFKMISAMNNMPESCKEELSNAINLAISGANLVYPIGGDSPLGLIDELRISDECINDLIEVNAEVANHWTRRTPEYILEDGDSRVKHILLSPEGKDWYTLPRPNCYWEDSVLSIVIPVYFIVSTIIEVDVIGIDYTIDTIENEVENQVKSMFASRQSSSSLLEILNNAISVLTGLDFKEILGPELVGYDIALFTTLGYKIGFEKDEDNVIDIVSKLTPLEFGINTLRRRGMFTGSNSDYELEFQLAVRTTEPFCISFDPESISLVEDSIYQLWILCDGGNKIAEFSSKDEASDAKYIIQHYGMNKRCLFGDPRYEYMEFWLVDDESPVGPCPSEEGHIIKEDCIIFNPETLQVVEEEKNKWHVQTVCGRSLLSFAERHADAEKALSIIQNHGFNHLCYVNADEYVAGFYRNASMRYFRRHSPLENSCQSFDPKKITVDWYEWSHARICDDMGNTIVGSGPLNEVGIAWCTIKHYGMTQRCWLGDPFSPSMEYWLVQNQAPNGPYEGEDCAYVFPDLIQIEEIENRYNITDNIRRQMFPQHFIEKEEALIVLEKIKANLQGKDYIIFDPEIIQIEQMEGIWYISDGIHRILEFAKEDEAKEALSIIRRLFDGEQSHSLDYENLQTVENEGKWDIADGDSVRLYFGDKEEAQKALSIITEFGSADASVSTQELMRDCITFGPGSLNIAKINDRWWLRVGNSKLLLDFKTEEEAQKALMIIDKYGFSQFCCVNEPDPVMVYFRRYIPPNKMPVIENQEIKQRKLQEKE